MKIIRGDGGGITFRATYNHYSGYTLFVFRNGHYQLTLYTNGHAAKTFAVGTSTAIKQGLNQINVLAVSAQSSNIKLYANHQLIAHFNDGIYSQGLIGFIANAMSSSADVTYTDAKIWAL